MDNAFKILVFLGKNPRKAYTMHDLSQKIQIPYATLYRTIRTMDSLITKKRVGKAVTIALNFKNPLVKHYLIIGFEEEAESFVQKQPLFKKIRNELPRGNYCVLVFGSFAKESQTKTSDIDIMIINKDGEKSPRFNKYETIFKKTINPIYITQKEFKLMLKEKQENVGKQALQNHIILYNPEVFWNIVMKNGI